MGGKNAGLTAVIFVMEPSDRFDACLESVKKQTLQPDRIEIVRNVSPNSAATIEGMKRVETEYYVSIDEDMVLYPDCFEKLYGRIRKSDNTAEVVFQLHDQFEGPILGVRIYRTSAVKSVGFREDEYEHLGGMHQRLIENGYSCPVVPGVMGLHRPGYTPEEAFWRFRTLGIKSRLENRDVLKYLNNLVLYWYRTGEITAVHGLAGFFDGLIYAGDENEYDYNDREKSYALRRSRELFGALKNVVPLRKRKLPLHKRIYVSAFYRLKLLSRRVRNILSGVKTGKTNSGM